MAKEKTVELKPKAEKISKEHLDQLQKIVNSINKVQFDVGKMEVQKHHAMHELSNMQDQISLMQDTLKKTYGSYDVNVNDGTINWPEESSDEK
jgi:hypothetical protein|tara:strand:+ start:762 stop:1040 length:279 start_codon:yes stop_codon:yes gene_type:complete